jgi:hypothetical protein
VQAQAALRVIRRAAERLPRACQFMQSIAFADSFTYICVPTIVCPSVTSTRSSQGDPYGAPLGLPPE